MAIIEEELNLLAASDKIYFNTALNGDLITIRELHLSKEEAATLAWLVNHADRQIKIVMKLKPLT